ncbi:hypothetical protein DMA11_02995 [Marinilabiliaceae bacterium JC017]|nr:hypothetical protein DMA11_02995 [Marinilabiliaceae bacterium JC017]
MFTKTIKDCRWKLILVVLIAFIQILLYLVVKHIQIDLRPTKPNLFLNSFPSLAHALGTPLILWVILKKKYYKTLILGFVISFSHEFIRLIDDKIPIDIYDLLFILIGTCLAIALQYGIHIIFIKR